MEMAKILERGKYSDERGSLFLIMISIYQKLKECTVLKMLMQILLEAGPGIK